MVDVYAMQTWAKKAEDQQYQTDLRLRLEGVQISVFHKGRNFSVMVDWKEIDQARIDVVSEKIAYVNTKMRETIREEGIPAPRPDSHKGKRR